MVQSSLKPNLAECRQVYKIRSVNSGYLLYFKTEMQVGYVEIYHRETTYAQVEVLRSEMWGWVTTLNVCAAFS